MNLKSDLLYRLSTFTRSVEEMRCRERKRVVKDLLLLHLEI